MPFLFVKKYINDQGQIYKTDVSEIYRSRKNRDIHLTAWFEWLEREGLQGEAECFHRGYPYLYRNRPRRSSNPRFNSKKIVKCEVLNGLNESEVDK